MRMKRKRPKNLTLSDSTLEKADLLIAAMDTGSLSNLVATLILQEWERRNDATSVRHPVVRLCQARGSDRWAARGAGACLPGRGTRSPAHRSD